MAQPIAFTQVNSRQIDFAVNASSDGWLLWRRVWYPGWRATLDGIDTEIVQANALFQAVFRFRKFLQKDCSLPAG